MAPRNRNLILGSGLVLVVCLAAIVYVVPRSDVLTESLPGRIADRDFWTLVSDSSEGGIHRGYPEAEYARAPDVQGFVRAFRGSGAVSIQAVFPPCAGRRGRQKYGGVAWGFQRCGI